MADLDFITLSKETLNDSLNSARYENRMKDLDAEVVRWKKSDEKEKEGEKAEVREEAKSRQGRPSPL